MHSKKMLLLDDEPHLISSVTDRLEFEYGVDSYIYTQYFDECINALQINEISCLSLDLIMPRSKGYKFKDSLINGLNALKQIRNQYPDLPIACYTVINEEEIIQNIEKMKANYICKNNVDGFYLLMEFFKKYTKL